MNILAADERSLIRAARAGDNAAFERLVMAYTPRLFRVMCRMASDPAEAEAIVQEAFLRAWQSLPRYSEDRPFFPYLVTIAFNLARDQWREARFLDFGGLDPAEENIISSEPGPESQLEQVEMLHALSKAVSSLPPAYRSVIALRYDAGLSYQEIAETLKLPINTVRTHLRRAKDHLRVSMEEENRVQTQPIQRLEWGRG